MAQQQVGRPEITNYDYQEYNGSPANWWAVEGAGGLMFFANERDVLEYDGIEWKHIKTGNGCRSLAKGDDGIIYVGGFGGFGYLQANKYGELKYQSLKEKIPEEYRDFQDVWMIDNFQGKIYFTTSNYIYVWDGKSIQVLQSDNMFHISAVVNGKFYCRIWNKGLCVLKDGKFELVPGGEQFAEERIYEMLPYDDHKVLLGTRDKGFFLYDGKTIRPFKTEVDKFIQGVIYSPGVALQNGNFIINTFQGAYLMDHKGRLLQEYTKATGLKNEGLYFVYVDSRNILWLLSYGGISMLNLQSPYTYLGSEKGIPADAITQVQKKEDFLYLATNQNGIYYRKQGQEKFSHIVGTTGQTFTIKKVKGRLYVASTEGLLEIKGNSFEYVRKSENYDFRANFILPSEKNPNTLFVGAEGKIAAFNFDEKTSQFKEVSSLEISFLNIINDKDDNLWITNNDKGKLTKLIPEIKDGKVDLEASQIITYDTVNGLPDKTIDFFKPFDKVIFVDSENKTFRFDPMTNTFKKYDTPINKWMDINKGNFVISKDSTNKVFASLGEGVIVAEQEGDSVQINASTFKQLKNVAINDIFPGPVQADGTQEVWFATAEGLIRYEGKLGNPQVPDFDLQIRNINIAGDSLLYAGAGSMPEKIQMNYKNNSISFSYAAPVFEGQKYVEYSTYLKGFDSRWSDYSKQTSREYLNLPAGNYTFKVKAKSSLGKTSDEVSVPFSIASPWYLTWWAYILYALAFIAIIYLIVHRRTRMLRTRQKVLEERVAERTREVQKRLGELATINHVSTALTEKLKLNELIQLVGDEMKKLFNSDITYLALLDRENNIINFPYQDGDNIKPQKIGNGLTSKIITTGEPLLINRDTDIVAEFDKMGIKESGKRAVSYLGVPIPVEDKIIGAISVQSTQQESRFNEEDKRLLNTIAINVGVALHNAELFEQAREAKIRAEEANEAKSAFLSTVSHELRTPLTSVLGFAKIIRKRLEDKIFPAVNIDDQKIKKTMKQVSENLDVVVSEGERLTTLINDVLDLAKIESGRMEWNMKPVLMQDAIGRAIASTKSLFENKKVSLKKNIPKDLPMVNGDEDKLIQVVINLLSNAVKFTDKGKVQIEAYLEKDQIIVEVQDTGIGIAEEDRHKVFEKFRQAGDTLTDKPKGTGLGLPICREIIEHHGGIIWMKSELGVGSTFFFSIPVLGEGVPQQPLELDRILKSLKKQIKHSSQKANVISEPTILVVDDATPIRSLLRQELSEAGYRVKEAENGKEALEMVRNSKPDLIILDVMMPEINGFDVAAVLKNDPSTMDIPIIILSIVKDKERGLRIGVDRYLTKPINTEELFHEVDVLLEQGVSKKKVLVVDEDFSAVKTLSEVLSARGYKVVESNSKDLFETATKSRPDIIMLNSVSNGDQKVLKDLKLQKGMENVMFFIYK
ncbi:response regulator [Christiangramia fulva]|nr:response regulator [Christiangramia fulva]